MRSNEFVRSLPRGPLVRHVEQIHVVVQHIASASRTGQPIDSAMAILEHSLREIVRYTATSEYELSEYERREGDRVLMERRRADAQQVFAERFSSGSPFTDIAAAMKKAFASVEANLAKMQAKRTPEQRDLLSQGRYKRAVREERAKAEGYVKREAARVRAELRARGLNIDA